MRDMLRVISVLAGFSGTLLVFVGIMLMVGSVSVALPGLGLIVGGGAFVALGIILTVLAAIIHRRLKAYR